MQNYLEQLLGRHRRLDRMIDNCKAAHRQEDLKQLKRIRLRLRDRIAELRRQALHAG